MFFLERGFTDAFLLSIRLLTANSQWEEVIRVVDVIFDKVIAVGHYAGNYEDQGDEISAVFHQLDNTANSTSSEAAENVVKKRYVIASREWLLWTSALNAIRNLPSRQQ